MSTNTENKLKLTALTILATFALVIPATAHAAPIKEVETGRFGEEVDLTTGGNVCTVVSKDTCQPGKESTIAGGLSHPFGVAGASNGDIYIADTNNDRVQELTSTGSFVRTFGTSGALAGQLSGDYSIAVDQVTGNVYVQDLFNWRIDEYTSEGSFVLMIGGEVNQTKDEQAGASKSEKNVCTAASGDICKGGVRNAPGSAERSAFNYEQGYGDILAVGGPENLLYVADEQRVQEFNTVTGAFVGEMTLAAISSATGSKVVDIAVSGTGEVYLVYRVGQLANVIRKFAPDGKETVSNGFPLVLSAGGPGAEVEIEGIALDTAGRLAVSERVGSKRFGLLYDGSTGHLITQFVVPLGARGIGFNGNDELYLAVSVNNEIVAYHPLPVAELLTEAPECKAGAPVGTDVTIDCTLNGLVNPEEVPETEAWFQWGKTTALEFETPKQPVEEIVPGEVTLIQAPIGGLRPNSTYYDRVDARDRNVKAPELLTSETAAFTTSAVPPLILGEPEASFVKASSAVLFGELNPENAQTEYFFEYGSPEELEACPGVRSTSCPGVASTGALVSSVYGEIGATLEAQNLLPSTEYAFRLAAVSENSAKTEKLEAVGAEEGVFETAPAPAVSATTGVAEAITSTSAVVAGTVNPDGQPATYVFELGVDRGPATSYGVVFSGATGADTAPVEKLLLLTSLQPGTVYAFRIKIEGGYGAATGVAAHFATLGEPEIIKAPASPVVLPVPPISFPKEPTPTPCKRGYVRDKHGKCVKQKKKKGKKARSKGARGKNVKKKK